eukprot:3937006-Rhodomonas_salina.2
MLAVMTDGAVRTTEITFSIILPVRGFVVDPVCSENLYIKGRSLGSSTHLLALSLYDVCKANPRLGVMEKDPPSGDRNQKAEGRIPDLANGDLKDVERVERSPRLTSPDTIDHRYWGEHVEVAVITDDAEDSTIPSSTSRSSGFTLGVGSPIIVRDTSDVPSATKVMITDAVLLRGPGSFVTTTVKVLVDPTPNVPPGMMRIGVSCDRSPAVSSKQGAGAHDHVKKNGAALLSGSKVPDASNVTDWLAGTLLSPPVITATRSVGITKNETWSVDAATVVAADTLKAYSTPASKNWAGKGTHDEVAVLGYGQDPIGVPPTCVQVNFTSNSNPQSETEARALSR